MAFDKYKDGAWQEPESDVKRYADSAWQDCEFAKRYVDNAWEEVWSAFKAYIISQSAWVNGTCTDYTVGPVTDSMGSGSQIISTGTTSTYMFLGTAPDQTFVNPTITLDYWALAMATASNGVAYYKPVAMMELYGVYTNGNTYMPGTNTSLAILGNTAGPTSGTLSYTFSGEFVEIGIRISYYTTNFGSAYNYIGRTINIYNMMIDGLPCVMY